MIELGCSVLVFSIALHHLFTWTHDVILVKCGWFVSFALPSQSCSGGSGGPTLVKIEWWDLVAFYHYTGTDFDLCSLPYADIMFFSVVVEALLSACRRLMFSHIDCSKTQCLLLLTVSQRQARESVYQFSLICFYKKKKCVEYNAVIWWS